MKKTLTLVIILLAFFAPHLIKAQIAGGSDLSDISYSSPREYEIGGITVSGTQYLDKQVLVVLSGLTIGEKILVPGDKISKCIQNLWNQGLFADIKISASKIVGDKIFIDIQLEERPRLSKFSIKGVKKSQADDIREEINLAKGKVVTENLIATTKNKVKDHFVEDGYLNAEVFISEQKDTSLANTVILTILVKKGPKTKIKNITFYGNNQIKSGKLRRKMKDTKQKKWYAIFTTSKYLESAFETDKQNVLNKYYEEGFRDAKIVKDTTYRISDKFINLDITIEEGKKYYFRNITWLGNTKHTSEELNRILSIKKGDVFNQSNLDSRLYMSQDGRDVSSLYMDDGYLFFQINPIEVLVQGDSIDMEMRIYEGKQARINKVTVVGNTKTNDHVIMREIRTKPGQLFSRADIIRSQRELSQLSYFDPEKMGVNPKPNPADGTVDIEYVVEEKPSDQVEFSGGWGGGRVVGTLGVSFNNFSLRNFLKREAWRPLPAGDGQTLSVRAQSSGLSYQSYSLSFIEPWLGGKKPNSFSFSAYHSVQSNGQKKKIASNGEMIENPDRRSIEITGISLGLGKRLKVPDDFFTLYQEVSYQYYVLNRWSNFVFTEGYSNNINYRLTLSRNSIDQPIYPRSGSQLSLSFQTTPPYSVFSNKTSEDYAGMSLQEKYKFVELHKWKFNASWFTKITGNLVLNTKIGYGFLGSYNKNLGTSPFERFVLGGSGLSGFDLLGSEIVGLRGYDEGSLSPDGGAAIVSKYTLELRYPVSLNPSATIYGLAFVEGGDSWNDYKAFSPFEVKRSAGFGIRVFLPMFGLLGLDWGYRMDNVTSVPNMDKSQFHFLINANMNTW